MAAVFDKKFCKNFSKVAVLLKFDESL